MPRILAPYPTAAERRRGALIPDGRIKFPELARAAWIEHRTMIHLPETRPAAVAVDTETTGVEWWDSVFCVTMSWRLPTGELRNHYFELDEDGSHYASQILSDLLSAGVPLVFHNAGFDIQKLIRESLIERANLTPTAFHDTWGQAHLLDTTQVCKLKVLAKKYLGETTNEAATLAACRRALKLTSADGFDPIPRWVLMPYALKDTEFTLRLHELLYPQVAAYPDTMHRKYIDSMEEILTLYDISANGMGVDRDYVDTTLKEYSRTALAERREIQELVGQPVGREPGEFNPASPDQVAAKFAERGVILPATDKHHLRLVSDPLAGKLLDLRSTEKMRTYLKALLSEARGSVLHPPFRPFGAKTGRMASGAAEK